MTPKFRAWDKRFSEFVEDFFVSEDGNIYKKSTDTGYGIAISRETSDKVILMQSTGLKDKNGVEIFEGDVVKCNGLLGTIESFKAMWICSFVEYNNYQKVGFFAQEIEVVGNIYENPELLEDLK